MSRNITIGLTGLPGVGKDTIAKWLVENHGFVSIGFADALKLEAAKAFGVNKSLFNDREHKTTPHPYLCMAECTNIKFIIWFLKQSSELKVAYDPLMPRSPRFIMQAWGDFRRSENPHYWVGIVMSFIVTVPKSRGVCITDVRYSNEASEILRLPRETYILRVERPRNPFVDTGDHHSSNTPLPEGMVDGVIVNREYEFNALASSINEFVANPTRRAA